MLVSDDNDYYYEQCLISMLSLKKNMENAEISVLVDEDTKKNLNAKREEIRKYANLISYDFGKKYTTKVKSRLLKIKTRGLITGPFVFVDVDSVVAESLEELFKCDSEMAMVLDKHCVVDKNVRAGYIKHNAKRMNYSEGFENRHFNSGVIWVKDTEKTREFYALWEKLYLECVQKGIYIDQTSLNEANNRFGGFIEELPGEWNVQLDCGLRYISRAKILHYSGYQPFSKEKKYHNLLPFELCDEKLLAGVKESGRISKDIERIIQDPKSAFKQSYIIPDDCIAYELIFSNHFRVLKYLFVKHRVIFNLFENVYSKLFKILYGRA